MKKLISFFLIVFLLTVLPAFSEETDIAYEKMSWALCEKLMEKTREAAKENTAGVREDVFVRVQAIASLLPENKPESVIFIDMDEMTRTLKANAEEALADALANVSAVSTRILSYVDEETLESAMAAANAFYDKAEDVLGVISDEFGLFSNSVMENITEEDLEELKELGEAFSGQVFSILGSMLEGAGKYTQGLFERLPEDTQNTINAFIAEASEKLDSIFDEQAIAFVNEALTLTHSYSSVQTCANGFIIFDTGESVVPAVSIQHADSETVVLTAMYMDRAMADMLLSIENTIE